MASARVLVTLALRSLTSHRTSSLVVGGIISFGTCLFVLGTSLLDSVDRAMATSITSSLAGHLQVYSKDAQDELALFGSGIMGAEEIGAIPDFARVRSEIEQVEGVRAVVPMGIHLVVISSGNTIDRLSERLRAALAAKNDDEITLTVDHLRAVAQDLRADVQRGLRIALDKDKAHADAGNVDQLLTDEFWTELSRNPEPQLQFIETKIAPLQTEGQLAYLRNLGTDLTRFAELFDRFEIVRGERVPPGHRGLLFARRVHEDYIKNKVARELDKLYEGVTEQGKRIASDAVLADLAKRLPGQYRRITLELHPSATGEIDAWLRQLFKDSGESPDFAARVQRFLTVDDSTIRERHRQFYERFAPRMQLYRFDVGDTLTLRAYTKSGYIKSANVKVYGIYQFKSLERSDLAGSQNLVDLATFRELYGVMGEEQRRELAEIRSQVGLAEISRDDAESALFGTAIELETTASGGGELGARVPSRVAPGESLADTYDPATLDRGLALNAAVLLADPADLDPVRRAIERRAEEKGLNIQVIDWRAAAGMVGQFVTVVRVVLYVAIFIVFLVALAIINNSLVMATLQRTGEIGTMRAIGAQRRFISNMFLVQTLTLGGLAGALGAAAGGAGVWLLSKTGIPAGNDIMVFLFSGPRLYPTTSAAHMFAGLAVILTVSLAATLYPARVAAAIQPVVAMQAKE